MLPLIIFAPFSHTCLYFFKNATMLVYFCRLYISCSSYLESVVLSFLAQTYPLFKTFSKIQELFHDSLILFLIPHSRKHIGNCRLIGFPNHSSGQNSVFFKSDGYVFPLLCQHSSRNEVKD